MLIKELNDLISSINYLRNTDNCNGKVGTVGYCLGGKLSYLLSCRSNADCNVSYYGVGLEGLLDESSKIKKPYLSHIAEKDSFVPKDAQQKNFHICQVTIIVIYLFTQIKIMPLQGLEENILMKIRQI